jgi:hypothetical protein
MQDAQDEDLIAAHAIDHEPPVERQGYRDAAEFVELRCGGMAPGPGARKAAELCCGVKDGGEEAVCDGWSGLTSEPVPTAVDLTKSCC